jgi:hypothetical protein
MLARPRQREDAGSCPDDHDPDRDHDERAPSAGSFVAR